MNIKPSIVLVFGVVNFACSVYASVNCNVTLGGRHADPDDVTCKNYTLCVYSGNNVYIPVNFGCPENTLFSPIIGRCSSNYVCNSTLSTKSSCTSPGKYPVPDDTQCKSYFWCVAQPNNTLARYNYTCPANFVFHPTAKVCTAFYTCPYLTSTSATTTSTTTTTTTTSQTPTTIIYTSTTFSNTLVPTTQANTSASTTTSTTIIPPITNVSTTDTVTGTPSTISSTIPATNSPAATSTT